jgi:hypothetical protein
VTAISLALSDYVRGIAKTRPILLRNMYVEKDPGNQVDGLVRLQRPVLALFATLPESISRGAFRHAGVFGGDYLCVYGASLYRVTAAGAITTLGAISGSGRVIFAASPARVLIATGGTCYSTDGASVTAIAMPDGQPVSSVAFIDAYFILTVTGTARFYWLAPGDTDPDALNFATVENSPGFLQICIRLQDELWFIKEQSLEVWQVTGDLDAPFIRIGGRLYERGTANRFTAAVLDNALFWVGDDLIVYRGEGGPKRVSDHSIEERLREAGPSALEAFLFASDGHTFFALRIGTLGTFIYDVENGNWAHWSSYGREVWRANAAAQDGGTILCGDDVSGALWRLDATLSHDHDAPLERILYGGVAVVGPVQRCNVVRLFCSTGTTLDTAAEPVAELNWCDDDSGDFDDPWMPMSLGRQGDRTIYVEARQLGVMYAPGRLFAFRMTDDAQWRVSYARLNEAD